MLHPRGGARRRVFWAGPGEGSCWGIPPFAISVPGRFGPPWCPRCSWGCRIPWSDGPSRRDRSARFQRRAGKGPGSTWGLGDLRTSGPGLRAEERRLAPCLSDRIFLVGSCRHPRERWSPGSLGTTWAPRVSGEYQCPSVPCVGVYPCEDSCWGLTPVAGGLGGAPEPHPPLPTGSARGLWTKRRQGRWDGAPGSSCPPCSPQALHSSPCPVDVQGDPGAGLPGARGERGEPGVRVRTSCPAVTAVAGALCRGLTPGPRLPGQ